MNELLWRRTLPVLHISLCGAQDGSDMLVRERRTMISKAHMVDGLLTVRSLNYSWRNAEQGLPTADALCVPHASKALHP